MFGCDTSRSEWVHRGEWVYVNSSTHTLELKGAVNIYTSSQPPYEDFTLKQGESHIIEYRGDGDKVVESEAIPNPFGDIPFIEERSIQILIDGNQIKAIAPETYIRSRANYQVEKLGRSYYRFTYTFTDEIISELIK